MKGPQSRLVKRLGFCAALALIALVAIPLQLASDSLSDESVDRVSEVSAITASSVALQINSLSSAVDGFSRRGDVGTWLTARQGDGQGELEELRLSNGSIRSVALIDAAGRVVMTEPYNPNALDQSVAYRDYFTAAIAGDTTYESTVFLGRLGNDKLLAISRAVRDANGSVVGVVVVSVDVTKTFQNYIDRFGSMHDAQVSLYDQSGQVIAGPGALPHEIAVTTDRQLEEARRGESTVAVLGSGNNAVIAGFSRVEGTGYVVKAAVPRNAAFAPVAELRTRVVALSAIVSILLVFGFVALTRSVKGRGRVEAELRHNEQRTRAIIETAAQGFFEADSDGNITEWNKQAEIMFGYTRSEVLGKSMHDVVPALEKRQSCIELAEQVLKFPSDLHEPISINGMGRRRVGDEPFPMDLTVWRTEVNGMPHLNAFLRDTTERRRLDAEREGVMHSQRKLVAELQEADKAKNDFVSTISHELRTPLASIVGYLEMLTDGYAGQLNDRQRSMLDVIDRNSQRLLSLIEDLLTLSRIESGNLRAPSTRIDVELLVRDAEQALMPSARERGLAVDVDVEPDAGALAGDVVQLERVFLNLMTNAIKFTPDGGRVAVRVYREAQTVHIKIADTGIGIALEEQHRLFSRFFRASSAREQEIQGTGLGLAIVKSIVEHHGGSIGITSVLGQGTEVHVQLPTADVPVATRT